MNCICTGADLGFAVGGPLTDIAEAPPVLPVADLAPLGPPPLIGAGMVIAWMTTGLLAAFVLSRQGHDGRSTAALGFVFGPLFVPLAMEVRKRRHEVEPVVVSPGRRGDGPVDVLVVFERGPAGAASALPVLQMLGDRLGRLALGKVIDFESMQDEEERRHAELELSCGSLFLCERDPALVLLAGRPSDAAHAYAVDAGYHLVVLVGGSRSTLLRRPRRRPDAPDAPVERLPGLTIAHVSADER